MREHIHGNPDVDEVAIEDLSIEQSLLSQSREDVDFERAFWCQEREHVPVKDVDPATDHAPSVDGCFFMKANHPISTEIHRAVAGAILHTSEKNAAQRIWNRG